MKSAILTPKRTEYGKSIRKAYESGKIKESRHNMTELEPRTDGISNTLTTVQKDNLLIEVKQIGNMDVDRENFENPQCGRVYDSSGLSPTINTCQGGQREPKIIVKSKGNRFNDISSCKFGKLTAIEPIGKKNGSYVRRCKCDCGNYTNVCARDLNSGHTKSYGCIGRNKFPKVHGMSNERIYRIWKDMNQRCNSPNNHAYKRYGGRGIIICSEWLGENGFQNFCDWSMKNGYSDDLEIDRIDNDGHYEPSNCKWSTRKEQMNNVSYNNMISAFGQERTLSQWSEIAGINASTITSRIRNGWSSEEALSVSAKLGANQYTICGLRGRNPDNPSDRTAGSPTEQRLEPNSQCICNTLTSAQKDNMVLEETVLQIPRGYNNGGCHKICPPITSHSFQENNLLRNQYRIRKLTTLECWRLMGFSDEDFRKAEEVNSNSQLYKQAGNSIVKNVLMAIFGKMIHGKENLYKEL